MKKILFICMIELLVILTTGCVGEKKSETKEQLSIQQFNSDNQEYMEQFKEPCEMLVRLKLENGMKNNKGIPYTENVIEEKYRDKIENCRDVIKKFAKQEHIYLNKTIRSILSEEEEKKLQEIGGNTYKDLQYDIDTSSNNNIVTVAVSMRCIDDKAMAKTIEDNFRKRLQMAFPKQYKKDMLVQNLVDTAAFIIPNAKKRIEELNNVEWARNGKLSPKDKKERDDLWNEMRQIKASTTDGYIMIMFSEELIKAYKNPIYMNDRQTFYYHFLVSQNKISEIKDGRTDINRMFWLGVSSAKNATKSESIDNWIATQWSWRQYER